MAMTHDYLDYLNERVGISPANSQEELQASQVISDLMAQHNVEPRVEEFEAPMVSALGPAILFLAMFIGAVVCGVGVLPLTVAGIVLAALPAVLSILRVFGYEFSPSIGPKGQSQNVIAFHPAEGPLVTKGSRKIVIVAHYDSPHENFLYSSPLASYLPLIHKATVPCSLVTAVCALLQPIALLPDAFRIVAWLLGIVAAAPALVVAVGAIAERFASCSEGANDNKAAVAALLGVLENVRPSGLVPRPRPAAKPEAQSEEGAGDAAPAEADAAEPGPAAEEPAAAAEEEVVEDVTPLGKRHGEGVLRSLGILPESCEIVYVAPPAPRPSAGATASLRTAAAEEDPAGTTREDLLSTGTFSIVMDDGSRGVGPKDSTGVMVMSDEFDADATQATPAERPDAPSDPSWGKTSFRPQLSNVARRATLFDLPDPSAREVDPFDTDPNATRLQQADPAAVDGAEEPAKQEVAPLQPLSKIVREKLGEDSPVRRFGAGVLDRLRGLGRSLEEEESSADEDDAAWRGGAASREGLRLVDEGEAPSEDELRDAVLSLVDDELVAHDIWFVALGGSSLGHAGMQDFIARHRSEVRGCFVVNLDCIGAGTLTALKNEGLEGTRRADRRLTRLLTNVSNDLHIELASAPYDWCDTDATPAMRSSLRAVTLMGLGANGLPALSRTADDVPENVSGDRAADVAAIVTEMIRRS